MPSRIFKAVIAGAGPAGLTAAYELSKQDAPVVVLEADPEYVGGISRTVNYKGFVSISAAIASFPNRARLKIFGPRSLAPICLIARAPRAFTIAASSTPIR